MATKNRKNGLTHRLYTGEISYDFVGRRKRWYAISALILLLSIGTLVFKGLNLGIEFKGGADFQAPVAVSASTVEDVRAAVVGTNVPDMDGVSVKTIGTDRVRIQTRTLSQDEVVTVREAIAEAVGIPSDRVAYNLIGASWGQQITQKGLIALGVFLVLVMLMIWAYFRDAKMSFAAIAALLHDLVVTVGIYALVGFTVTPSTLIGVLTILGYSLYDTVVVFDKVRENVTDLSRTRLTYAEAANRAVNQVLVRSLNTTLIGVLPVAAILIAGAFVLRTGPLQDLGLALFVGMIAGAYSSVFIATPLLVDMKEAEPGMKEHRARLERRAARHSDRSTVSAAATSAAVASGTGATRTRTRQVVVEPDSVERDSVEPQSVEAQEPTTAEDESFTPYPRGARVQRTRASRSQRSQGQRQGRKKS